MYARSTTFLSRPEALDAGIALVRDEVMPAVTAMDGCLGLSAMVDRESGRCIVTTSWRSEDAMRATAAAVQPLRDRGAEILGGDMTVAEWEIALMHRMHHSEAGACIRSTWVRVDADKMDTAIDMYRNSSLTELDQVAGFCGASLFVDRTAGLAVSSASWADRAAMESSRDMAAGVRQRAAEASGLEVLEVAEFDLVVAHLRVPEMV